MCQKEEKVQQEFKASVCALVIKDKLTPQIVAEKMGLNEAKLYRWVPEYQQNGVPAFAGAVRPTRQPEE